MKRIATNPYYAQERFRRRKERKEKRAEKGPLLKRKGAALNNLTICRQFAVK
jgi:hypothetical protein